MPSNINSIVNTNPIHIYMKKIIAKSVSVITKTEKQIIVIVLSLLLCSLESSAQSWAWAKDAGGNSNDQGNSIATDAAGNVYVTGFFQSASITFGSYVLNNDTTDGSSDIFIVKYNSAGVVQWAKRAGGKGLDYAYSICTDQAGNVFVTGSFFSSQIIFGSHTLYNAGGLDIFIVKYDSNGNVKWAKREGGAGDEEGYGITADASGSVYITGYYGNQGTTIGTVNLSNAGYNDIFIAKYDSTGNVRWVKRAGGNDYDYSYGIAGDASGNVFVTGTFGSDTIIFGSTVLTNPGMFLVKYDSLGNVLWAKQTSNGSYGYTVAADANGNAYVSGNFSGNINFGTHSLINSGVFTVKYDASGNDVWARDANAGIGYGYGVSADIAGNVYITGSYWTDSITFGNFTLNNSGMYDIFFVKYDSSGNVNWAFGSGGTDLDQGTSLATDTTGNLYATGFFQSAGISFGATTLNNYTSSSGSSDVFVSKFKLCTITQPIITAGGSTTFCEGDSVVLTSTSSNNYLWSDSATTQSITVTTAGSYSVTVTDTYGCSAASASVLVTVNPNPVPVITPNGGTSICTGNNVMLTSSVANNYLWSNADTTQSVTVSTGGNYFVTVTNPSGCTAISAPITVTVDSTPTPPIITASGSTSICQGDSITLTSTLANSYLWSDSSTSQSITVSAAGNYSVTISNGPNCSAGSDTTVVTVNANPSTPTITASGNTVFCQGDSVTLTSSSANGYLWSNSSTTQSITVLDSGNYSVTVSNSFGCTATVSLPTTVTVYSNPAVPVISVAGTDTLQSSPAYSYQWYLGGVLLANDTLQNIVPTQNGNYTVVVSNANGCTETSLAYYFNNVAVVGIKNENAPLIFPNPFNNTATLVFPNSVKDFSSVRFTLYDVLDREVKGFAVTKNNSVVDRINLLAGIYFYKVTKAGNIIASGKLIIE